MDYNNAKVTVHVIGQPVEYKEFECRDADELDTICQKEVNAEKWRDHAGTGKLIVIGQVMLKPRGWHEGTTNEEFDQCTITMRRNL